MHGKWPVSDIPFFTFTFFSGPSESPSRSQPATAQDGKWLIYCSSWLIPTTDFHTNVSDTYVETSEEDEVSLQCFPTSPIPLVDRFFRQKKSALGKLAYVVYAGNDVGVFYNW